MTTFFVGITCECETHWRAIGDADIFLLVCVCCGYFLLWLNREWMRFYGGVTLELHSIFKLRDSIIFSGFPIRRSCAHSFDSTTSITNLFAYIDKMSQQITENWCSRIEWLFCSGRNPFVLCLLADAHNLQCSLLNAWAQTKQSTSHRTCI